MKKLIRSLAVVVLYSSLTNIQAQPGSGSAGPDFSGAMAKLFGDNSAFSADAEVQAKNGKAGEDMTMPGKIAFLDGKSRFEVALSQMKGGKLPPEAVEQMKSMGMDSLVMISRPDKKLTYLIYPNLQAYAEMPMQNPEATKTASEFDVKLTAEGKETIAGHACVKNKAVVTDKNGKTHEFTVWNATDLKKFPVKIETSEHNMNVVILFKDVKFTKPGASQFEPTASFKKYGSAMALMQQEMMKRTGGTQGPR